MGNKKLLRSPPIDNMMSILCGELPLGLIDLGTVESPLGILPFLDFWIWGFWILHWAF